MCGIKSKPGLKRIGVILLLLLVALLPCYSLTVEETKTLTLIYNDLMTSSQSMKDSLSEQEKKINLLENSYQTQSANLTQLENQSQKLEIGLNKIKATQKNLENLTQDLQMNRQDLTQVSNDLNASLKKMELQNKVYKGLAIGGTTISIIVAGAIIFLLVK